MFDSKHLSILSVLSALTAVSLAAPRPQYDNIDWNNIGVNWNTIDYGNAGSQPAPTTQVVQVPVTTTVPPVVATPTTSSTPVVIPSTPAPTPSPSSGSGSGSSTSSGSKRGLAFDNTSPSLSVFDGSSGISWGWDWSSSRLELPSQYEFVPMMWAPDNAAQFDKDFNANPAAYVLSFNEPDNAGQANMPNVADSVQGHINNVNKYKDKGAKIGAVSVSNAGAPGGLTYLSNFLSQCAGNCNVDFCPVHWYGYSTGDNAVQTDMQIFQDFVANATDVCQGKPIWVTEFQKIGSDDDQKNFISQALPFLDGQASVERYSYFMVADGSLTSGGSLSEAGNAYVSS